MSTRTNNAGTSNGRHVWTRIEIEHGIVLRHYGHLNHTRIAQLLNAQFGTTKTTSTVQNTLDFAAGTLGFAELRKRKDNRQPATSILWQSIEALGPDSLEVESVLFQHGLISPEEWELRIISHRIASAQHTRLELHHVGDGVLQLR
ncbi:hypothetical protein MMC32_001282 [Xylographa parallela]|nr:hypothetical protein [Xylographa parallela]